MDTMRFEVYKPRLKKFRKFLDKNKDIYTFISKVSIDRGYWSVKVDNKYQFENGVALWKFYNDNIKI